MARRRYDAQSWINAVESNFMIMLCNGRPLCDYYFDGAFHRFATRSGLDPEANVFHLCNGMMDMCDAFRSFAFIHCSSGMLPSIVYHELPKHDDAMIIQFESKAFIHGGAS